MTGRAGDFSEATRARVVAALGELYERRPFPPPTQREIAAKAGLSAHSTAWRQLRLAGERGEVRLVSTPSGLVALPKNTSETGDES